MSENLLEMLGQWWLGLGGAATSALRILVILVVAWVGMALLHRAIRSFRIRIASRMEDREAIQRAETLGRVFRYLATVVVSLIAGMLILGEMGISVAPILGAAGVVGLAVGFGAQSLVKDYFTGFFILLENQIRQGDVVKLGDHSGMVEVVTLRHVQLRDYDGNVHFVPNGTITSVVNMTRGFSNAVMDIGVAYREDVDAVMAVMQEVAKALKHDPVFAPRILDNLDMAGVEKWGDSAVVIRCRLRCVPLEQWGVRREYLRRLKQAFDAQGIEIPYPHLTLYAGENKAGLAPAFRVATPAANSQHPLRQAAQAT